MINSTSSSDALLESNELSIKDDITSERREYLLKKWGPILNKSYSAKPAMIIESQERVPISSNEQ